jgi:hypothetical protein
MNKFHDVFRWLQSHFQKPLTLNLTDFPKLYFNFRHSILLTLTLKIIF